MLRVVVSASIWLVFGLSSMCGGEQEMYRFTFDCQDASLIPPQDVFCGEEEFSLSCPDEEVIVATVCLGGKKQPGQCNYTEGCHDTYKSMMNQGTKNAISDCLWSTNTCNIPLPSLSVISDSCSLTLLDQHAYVAAFNFQCIPERLVFDVCDNNNITVTNDSSVGYVRSPRFPYSDFGTKNCFMAIMAETRSEFVIVMQYLHLTQSSYFVEISTIQDDGSVVSHKNWTMIPQPHENYTVAARGIFIRYYKENAQEGFLLSYSVSDAEETTSPSIMTSQEPTSPGDVSKAESVTSHPVLLLSLFWNTRAMIT